MEALAYKNWGKRELNRRTSGQVNYCSSVGAPDRLIGGNQPAGGNGGNGPACPTPSAPSPRTRPLSSRTPLYPAKDKKKYWKKGEGKVNII